MLFNDVSFTYRERSTFSGAGLSALDRVSLEVRPGEKVGVVGANGAGKSTLLRLMAGILQPSSGSCDPRGMSRALLSLNAGFDADLSGAYNVVMHGMLSGLPRSEAVRRIPAVAEMAGLGDAINRRVATYSTGMRARLCFWTAMNLNVDVLLVDEVLSVGDLEFRQKSRNAMLDVIAGNRAVVIASHNLTFMQSVCDRVIWLHRGRVRSDGDSTAVVDNYRAFLSPASEGVPSTRNGSRRQIFVCGPPRSGTTALARLLNTSQSLVVGIERYRKRLMQVNGEDHRSLFGKERYFRYDTGDTDVDFNVAHPDLTQSSKRKFDAATYIGDKVPRLYRCLHNVDTAFPDCVVVYIIRDPIHVASSWQRRADSKHDRWPQRNGYQQAVIEWNQSVRFAMAARQRFGNRMILLSYERTFGNRRLAVWREMMRRLQLPAKPEEPTRRFLESAFRRAKADRKVDPEVLQYASRTADYITYARLLAHVL